MNEATVLGGQEVVGVGRIEGPILIVEGATNVSYDEVVEIRDSRGQLRRGRVLEVGEGTAVIQVFAGSTGLSIDGTRIRFLGDTLHMPVAEEMLGRIFDGLGNPIDGGPQPLTDHYADVNGQPINPTARVYPRDYIQTGISSIDGLEHTPARPKAAHLFWRGHAPRPTRSSNRAPGYTWKGGWSGIRRPKLSSSPLCLRRWA